MAVHFVNITKKAFLNDYKRVYRFTTIERFMELMSTSDFTFINPTKWSDPFEKFFLNRDFLIDDKKVPLPARNKVFAICVSGTISSEAYWKVYAPKEDGVRLTFNTEKLLENFLELIPNAEIYIGKVNYTITSEFHKVSFDHDKLIKEIESDTIGEEQIKLLLKKRKSFLYEDEIRIIIVPNEIQSTNIFKTPIDIRSFTNDYTFDPRLGKYHVKVLRDYFSEKYNFKISHSRLYSDLHRSPIQLKKEK